jgi:hypothetical protein
MDLIKYHMTRGDHLASSKIEAPIPLVIRQVVEEGTWCRARAELVRRSGRHVGKAKAAKDAHVIIC